MRQSTMIGEVPVASNEPQVVGNIANLDCAYKAIDQGAKIIEIRCDLVQPATIDEVVKRVGILRNKIPSSTPIIATIRKTIDGGKWYRFGGNDTNRLKIFTEILDILYERDAIDIEYGSVELKDKVTALAREKNKTVIHSYHNFTNTPPNGELEQLVENMHDGNCDIIKVACMTTGDEDYVRMFEILRGYVKNQSHSKPLALITMGRYGTPGRLVFPWFGSCLTYGCVGDAKAPGQPFVSDLVKYLKMPKQEAGITDLPIKDNEEGQRALKKLRYAFNTPSIVTGA